MFLNIAHFGKDSSTPPVPAPSPHITTTHPPNSNITYPPLPDVNEGGDPSFIDSSVDKPHVHPEGSVGAANSPTCHGPGVATPSPIPTPGVTNTAGTMVAGGGGHGSTAVTAGGGTGYVIACCL